jgi:hypothetical protein
MRCWDQIGLGKIASFLYNILWKGSLCFLNGSYFSISPSTSILPQTYQNRFILFLLKMIQQYVRGHMSYICFEIVRIRTLLTYLWIKPLTAHVYLPPLKMYDSFKTNRICTLLTYLWIKHLTEYFYLPPVKMLIHSYLSLKNNNMKRKYYIYDFRIKTMPDSSLPPVVCRRARVLYTLFVFVCV